MTTNYGTDIYIHVAYEKNESKLVDVVGHYRKDRYVTWLDGDFKTPVDVF